MEHSKQNRRTALTAILKTAAAACFIPAWNESIEAATATCSLTTPDVTEGPYWVDEQLFRSDIRTDPATGAIQPGVPLTVTITAINSSAGCAPLAGAYIDVWHCGATGIYSDESTYNPGGGAGNVTTTGQKFMRGYQIANTSGQVTFNTIYPGWYSGRTIHIHVRIRTYNGSATLTNYTTQIFFDDTLNNTVLQNRAYARSTARDTTTPPIWFIRPPAATTHPCWPPLPRPAPDTPRRSPSISPPRHPSPPRQ